MTLVHAPPWCSSCVASSDVLNFLPGGLKHHQHTQQQKGGGTRALAEAAALRTRTRTRTRRRRGIPAKVWSPRRRVQPWTRTPLSATLMETTVVEDTASSGTHRSGGGGRRDARRRRGGCASRAGPGTWPPPMRCRRASRLRNAADSSGSRTHPYGCAHRCRRQRANGSRTGFASASKSRRLSRASRGGSRQRRRSARGRGRCRAWRGRRS